MKYPVSGASLILAMMSLIGCSTALQREIAVEQKAINARQAGFLAQQRRTALSVQARPQSQPGIVRQIYATRFEPTFEDASRAALQNAQASFQPEIYKPTSPQNFANARLAQEAVMTKMMVEQAQAENEQAGQILNIVKIFSGGDPATMVQIINGLEQLPYEVTPQNAAQSIAALARSGIVHLPQKGQSDFGKTMADINSGLIPGKAQGGKYSGLAAEAVKAAKKGNAPTVNVNIR